MVGSTNLIQVATLKASHAKQIECVAYMHPLRKEVFDRAFAPVDSPLSDPNVLEAIGWARNTFCHDLPDGAKILLVNYKERRQLFWVYTSSDVLAATIANRKINQLFV